MSMSYQPEMRVTIRRRSAVIVEDSISVPVTTDAEDFDDVGEWAVANFGTLFGLATTDNPEFVLLGEHEHYSDGDGGDEYEVEVES